MTVVVVGLYVLVLVSVGNSIAAAISAERRSLGWHTDTWIVAALALTVGAWGLQQVAL